MGYAWNDLPAELRVRIEEYVGDVSEVVAPSAGTVSDFAGTLYGGAGVVFCKAVRAGNPQAWMHRNEAAVNGALPGIAPRMLWKVEVAGWLALGFERVPGRHADLSPGSCDVPVIVRTLEEMAAALTPAPPLRGFSLAERWAGEDFWAKLGERQRDRLGPWAVDRLGALIAAEREAPGLIDGRTLAHTDLTGSNILVAGDSVRVVDWAFPGPGAAWIDTAYVVLRLIQAGHAPAEAEGWAESVSMWREASPRAVTAFGAILTGMWATRAAESSGRRWGELSGCGQVWLRYRLG